MINDLHFNQLPKVPIVDATEAVVFNIRAMDRKGAIARNPERCVIAQGVQRVLNGDVRGVKIGACTSLVHFGDRIERYVHSVETIKLTKAYDAYGYYPTGVEVKLLPPSPTKRLGARRGEKKGGAKTGNGKPSVRSQKTPWLRHLEQATA